MIIKEFQLERNQSLFENAVDFNLSDSGPHALKISEILTPDEIKELLDFELGYGHTIGTPQLREAIARRYSGITADDIIVTNGTAEANFLSAFSLISEGDDVIVIVPNYLQFYGVCEAIGANVIPVHLNKNWQIPLDTLEQVITKKTKAIFICSPNNPSAQNMNVEDMAKIFKLAESVDAYVIVDEVYRELQIFEAPQPSHMGKYNKTIVNSSLSKAFGLPGLRIGWTIGPKEYLDKVRVRKDYTTITHSILGDFIANKVLQNSERVNEILLKNQAKLQKNYRIFEEWASEFLDIFHWYKPEAGAMIFIKYTLPISSYELRDKIRCEQSVLIVVGDEYGMESYLRIGIGADEECLKQGLERIAVVIREIQTQGNNRENNERI